jgi:hypothetical protein
VKIRVVGKEQETDFFTLTKISISACIAHKHLHIQNGIASVAGY